MLPLLELFGVREADAVDPLQRLSIGLPLPVGGGVLCDPVSLDLPRVAHVWPPTEVDQWTTAVDSGPGFCDLVMNDTALELIVLHHKRKKRGRAIGASLQHTSATQLHLRISLSSATDMQNFNCIKSLKK